ncbi:hypothetical protein ACFQY5_41245 [Paeniroseomonas aquatica]|uniref:Toxin-antitoxin system HicB family antitoxin n=1 Tax=Paeniroseomonas aquatica TaxID=373043 RepID=A0ABT8AFQ9_9PROT|nr:hypothetical protein [Paeniroseomonas aquatica]MDN3568673.1 hypothetical protein [Paeniroseomonas aquatica]
MAKKGSPINIRLRKDIRAEMELAAAADLRSLSGYIEKVLADFLVAKGRLPQPYNALSRDGRSVPVQTVSA